MSKPENNLDEWINSTDNINDMIDKFIIHLIKIQDEGKDFNLTKDFINKCIAISTRSADDIFKWLKENKNDSKYVFFFGIFIYYYVVDLKEENDVDGFKCFQKTSNDYPIAQLYLGRCYTKGFEKGLEKSCNDKGTEKTFFWYQKAAESGNVIAQFKLTSLYLRGIVHRDFHSGNILCENENDIIISDLGISKLLIESNDNNCVYYGIIPYVAPEIFQLQTCTKASDIYSFGIIMWELMTGRKPFWDRKWDIHLIIEIHDGIRPPIITDAPEGYIELMQKCWDSNPNERPTAYEIIKSINEIIFNEKMNPTKIMESKDIGPILVNDPGVISTGILTNSETFTIGKRKFHDDLIESYDIDASSKRIKSNEETCDESINTIYFSKSLEFDI
ncbi:9943_t:CDS:2 [Funneliformis geosporum]|uniref:9943_t:CDS:1 n=1 Tax=Funneliformis geosporum TaxID=1117311 RepID=A0A9W4SDF6_9GLOM|nr:9943_t:CDS:2 [Funneliformis geosporum]